MQDRDLGVRRGVKVIRVTVLMSRWGDVEAVSPFQDAADADETKGERRLIFHGRKLKVGWQSGLPTGFTVLEEGLEAIKGPPVIDPPSIM